MFWLLFSIGLMIFPDSIILRVFGAFGLAAILNHTGILDLIIFAANRGY